MPDEVIIDHLFTMLVGGHETTANTLSWLFIDLSLRPEVLARVHDELAALGPEGPLGLELPPACTRCIP